MNEGISERVRRHSALTPERIAVRTLRNGDTSFRHLDRAADRFAARFSARCEQGEPVLLYVSRLDLCLAAMLGAMRSGSPFAVLNRKLRIAQIEHAVRASRARLVLTDPDGLVGLRSVGPGNAPDLPGVQWAVLTDAQPSPTQQRMIERIGAYLPLEPWDVHDEPAPAYAQSGADDSVAACLFTSGSTGHPKGVLVSRRDLDARSRHEVELFGLEQADVLLNILPLSFDVGLNQVLSSLWAGATLVGLDSWLPADILRVVEHCGVTGISGVPSIWADFLREGLSFDTLGPHRSLRFITVSGGDLGGDHLERLPLVAPRVGIFKTYGQTEAFRAASLRPEEFETRRRSVGRPVSGVSVYVVREDGTVAGPDEVGEIVHTGLGTMHGYLNDEHDSKLRLNPFRGPDDPAEHAIYSGDLGWRDAQGYLYVKGRRDGMLKVAGNRVYPVEVANALMELEGVHYAAVVGVRHNHDTLLAAFVETGTADTDGTSILRAARDVLPVYMVPSRLEVLVKLPRTSSGKIDFPSLEAMAAQAQRSSLAVPTPGAA